MEAQNHRADAASCAQSSHHHRRGGPTTSVDRANFATTWWCFAGEVVETGEVHDISSTRTPPLHRALLNATAAGSRRCGRDCRDPATSRLTAALQGHALYVQPLPARDGGVPQQSARRSRKRGPASRNAICWRGPLAVTTGRRRRMWRRCPQCRRTGPRACGRRCPACSPSRTSTSRFRTHGPIGRGCAGGESLGRRSARLSLERGGRRDTGLGGRKRRVKTTLGRTILTAEGRRRDRSGFDGRKPRHGRSGSSSRSAATWR